MQDTIQPSMPQSKEEVRELLGEDLRPSYFDFGIEMCGSCHTPLEMDGECPQCGATYTADARPEVDFRSEE